MDQPDRYPDSDGPFAGPNNTFPVKDAAHVENAWARIHQGPTTANHSPEEVAGIKGKILARAKELGIALQEHADTAARSLPPDHSTIERRALLSPVELRSLPDSTSGGRMIGGYAAVFDRESRMISNRFGSPFVERITPGFFEESRSAGWPGEQGGGVLCRYNHNDQYLCGTVPGTCQLTIDRTGLEYRCDLPKCRDDVLELISRGDIRHSSYTMMDAQDDWNYSGGICQRTLISAQVLDVAPVSAVAAYQDTTVGLRSLAAHKDVPVDDVYALAAQQEIRKLFVRTDQALPAIEQRSVHIENVNITTVDPEEPAVADAAPTPPATDPAAPAAADPPAADPAATDPPADPPADPPPGTPPLADEPPATLSWQEAHLQLLATRPYDPIST